MIGRLLISRTVESSRLPIAMGSGGPGRSWCDHRAAEVVADVGIHPLDDGDHRDQEPDRDDDPEQGEKRTELAGANGLEGEEEGFAEGHPYPRLRPVLITFTLLNRVVAQPCDTALICPGCPLPSRKVPLSR